MRHVWGIFTGILVMNSACGLAAVGPAGTVRVRLLSPDGSLTMPVDVPRVIRSDSEWRGRLTAEQFRIGRARGTERAFCGAFHDNHLEGLYSCAGCGLPLFRSAAKFDSGTGWPSFFDPVARENIGSSVDRTLGMVREEAHCARCGMHLGHIFPDGPPPTGLRYCINSEVLSFWRQGQPPDSIAFSGVDVQQVVALLGEIPGVKQAVSDPEGILRVQFDPTQTTAQEVAGAVLSNGSTPTTGVTAYFSAPQDEPWLRALGGDREVRVDFLEKR